MDKKELFDKGCGFRIKCYIDSHVQASSLVYLCLKLNLLLIVIKFQSLTLIKILQYQQIYTYISLISEILTQSSILSSITTLLIHSLDLSSTHSQTSSLYPSSYKTTILNLFLALRIIINLIYFLFHPIQT